MEISEIVGMAMAMGFAIMSWYNLHLERKRSVVKEQQLIAAIMSKEVKDYVDAVNDLQKTAKEKLKEIKSEHELALEYNKVSQGQGIPIT
jgi:4-diphosphocytidyl-2C-methyl-D-erythritol kinase